MAKYTIVWVYAVAIFIQATQLRLTEGFLHAPIRCDVHAACSRQCYVAIRQISLKIEHFGGVTLHAAATSSSNTVSVDLEQEVASLKRVLEREYLSFFNPMRKEYYASTVTFDDPLTSLDGVDAYQNNVDMLGGRSLFGKIAFRDANINLHTITGGDVSSDGKTISDIVTRWTLRFTFQLMPWAPTAVFSGISVYGVKPTSQLSGASLSSPGVQIVSQADYWDSINLIPNSGGEYKGVEKSKALSDFLNQLNPNKVLGLSPSAMSQELPYTLLRRGDGYEVRRYPSFGAAKIQYDRRDEGYEVLGSFTRTMRPLSPAIMKVGSSSKSMMWPLVFKAPGSSTLEVPDSILELAASQNIVDIQPIPEQVVAIGVFDDASTEPVVRANIRKLNNALKRDGLDPEVDDEGSVTFAQYDAVYTMGKRRGEVWIKLADGGHPW